MFRMYISENNRATLLRFTAGLYLWIYKSFLYYISFLGPILVIYRFRSLSIYFLLCLAVMGFVVAGIVFLSLLVFTKRLFFKPAPGCTNIHTTEGKRWFAAAISSAILVQSPFWSMTNGLSLLGLCYYRGMGAKMPASVLLGARARITDPWFLEMGESAAIGAEAVILGHLGHGDEIVLGRVVIGDRAIVGMRAVIFPDVQIGRDARIGAGAVVVRGTTIPDGETWAGVPARKISSHRDWHQPHE